MKSILAAIVLSASAAFALAGYYFSTADSPGPMTGALDTSTFDSSLPVAARIDALEKAVGEERFARQLLEDEVFYLSNELERLSAPERFGPPVPEADDSEENDEPGMSRSERRRWERTREGRVERLVEAGFLPGQAEWIAQREQQLQMQALQERFEAERNGEDIDWMANRTMTSDALREELGDADYERYLEANDRSTSISVSSVIESSPAQTAGLMPGDQIVRYDGQRVFSMTDLTRQTMEGEPGQTVIVDVMRNGNLMQVVMPRGPVGITGGRRRF